MSTAAPVHEAPLSMIRPPVRRLLRARLSASALRSRNAPSSCGRSVHTPRRQPRRALLPADRQAAAGVTEFTATAGCGALAGIACCGPSFVLGLAQLLFALGGVATLVTLIQFEAPISLGIALIAWLGWRIATDRLSRAAHGLLAAVALLGGLGRLL